MITSLIKAEANGMNRAITFMKKFAARYRGYKYLQQILFFLNISDKLPITKMMAKGFWAV